MSGVTVSSAEGVKLLTGAPEMAGHSSGADDLFLSTFLEEADSTSQQQDQQLILLGNGSQNGGGDMQEGDETVWGMPKFVQNQLDNLTDEQYLAAVRLRFSFNLSFLSAVINCDSEYFLRNLKINGL